jgi:hypothetical protein
VRVNIDHYRRLWTESLKQPEVAGPCGDYWYGRVGQFARAIACEATRPFAVPVGITAKVSGLNPAFVGRYVGQLVRNGVLKVVERGAPGRYTLYLYGRSGAPKASSSSLTATSASGW